MGLKCETCKVFIANEAARKLHMKSRFHADNVKHNSCYGAPLERAYRKLQEFRANIEKARKVNNTAALQIFEGLERTTLVACTKLERLVKDNQKGASKDEC